LIPLSSNNLSLLRDPIHQDEVGCSCTHPHCDVSRASRPCCRLTNRVSSSLSNPTHSTPGPQLLTPLPTASPALWKSARPPLSPQQSQVPASGSTQASTNALQRIRSAATARASPSMTPCTHILCCAVNVINVGLRRMLMCHRERVQSNEVGWVSVYLLSYQRRVAWLEYLDDLLLKSFTTLSG
jgi:hypothetical protein